MMLHIFFSEFVPPLSILTSFKLETVEWKQRSKVIKVAFDLPDEMPVMFSSITGEGKKQIWKYIFDVVSDNLSQSKY